MERVALYQRYIINASDGMLLANGEIYAKRVELGDWDSPANYREITVEEYEKLIETDAEVT